MKKWRFEEEDEDALDLIHDLIGSELWQYFAKVGGAVKGIDYREKIMELCESYGSSKLGSTWWEGTDEQYGEMIVLASQVIGENE